LINNAVSLSTISLIEIKSPNDDNGSAVLARINAVATLPMFFESIPYILSYISGIGKYVPTPAGAVCLNEAAQGTPNIFLSSVTRHQDCTASI